MLKKIEFSYKKASINVNLRNAPSSIGKRKKIISDFIPILNNNNIIIYIDETALDENLVPIYGYSPKG